MNECEYCKKHHSHDGPCKGATRIVPCLIYERDPRGKRGIMNVRIDVPFGYDIPQVNSTLDVSMQGIDKSIELYSILNVEWARDGAALRGIILHAKIGYWTEENGIISKRPKLRVIK